MPEVSFMCDLHAHLADVEVRIAMQRALSEHQQVIGFLGGKWDRESSTVYIQAAFPCRAAAESTWDGMTDVEMDPSSDMHVREVIATQNLQVLTT